MPQLDLTAVFEALDGMRATHEKLVVLCTDKIRAVMENNTAALANISKQENRLMNDSRALDRKRAQAVAEIAPLLETAPEEVTVTMLAARAEPDAREKLLYAQKALLKALKEQKELNEKCRTLMQAHMDYAEMMLNLMVGDEDPLNNFYSASGTGAKERRQTAGILDKKA